MPKGVYERTWIRSLERNRFGGPRYQVNDDGCWVWLMAMRNGYGVIQAEGRPWPAHRFYYETLVGPILDGMELDHLCRNRACVNPEHLEPVTSRENLLRGETIASRNSQKTHCPAGHPLVEDNLAGWELKRGKRSCLRCHAARERRRKAAIA